jgi:hypothetical protein
MIKTTIALSITFIVLIQESLLAQIDSTKIELSHKERFAPKLVLPLSLVAFGGIVKETNFREYFQEQVQNSEFRTNTTIDDYIQYVPIAQMYVADIYSSKTKNQIFQQSKNLAIAEIFTAIIVQSVKHIANVRRPNGHDYSFFSGHTSQSFTGATALYLEYKDSDRLYALSGYGFSTATGMLRITNNKHWLSDVLVGAGVGMLSAQLTWYINPFKNWEPFKNSKVAVYPFVNGLGSQAGLCMVF